MKARLLGVLAIVVWGGCSLVVDTDECVTNADCDFGGTTRMQCVANECVAVTDTVQQSLVPESISEDLSLSADRIWVFEGAMVVEPGATMTVPRPTMMQIREHAVLVIAPGGVLDVHSPSPELLEIVLDENTQESD